MAPFSNDLEDGILGPFLRTLPLCDFGGLRLSGGFGDLGATSFSAGTGDFGTFSVFGGDLFLASFRTGDTGRLLESIEPSSSSSEANIKIMWKLTGHTLQK